MRVLSLRFCAVSPEAQALAEFFNKLGLKPAALDPACGVEPASLGGAIFAAGDSWIEVWPEGHEMPAGLMLQLVVDDAEAFAAHARAQGLDPQGPMDAHGERIFFAQAPGGLQLSFQSKL